MSERPTVQSEVLSTAAAGAQKRLTLTEDRAPDRLLRWAAIGFAVAVLIHNADHARRGGDSVTSDVFWIGSASILLEIAVVVMVLQRHRLAPLAAVATGIPLAFGYVLVHLTPRRTWLSDAFPGGDVSAWSWAAALIEIAAATALGLAGVSVLHRRGLAAASARNAATAEALPLGVALRHPVVVAMILGNAVIVFVSISGR